MWLLYFKRAAAAETRDKNHFKIQPNVTPRLQHIKPIPCILRQEWKNILVYCMWGGIITLIVIKNILWHLFWQTRIFLNELSWALDKVRRQSILKSTVSLSLLLSSFKTSCQCCAAPSSSTLPPSTLTWFLVYLHPYSDSFLFFLQCTLWKVSAPLFAVFIKLT